MSDIVVYNGSSTFTNGMTSFGYYDNDVEFRNDADRVIKWCARQMGFPVIEVELTNEQMYDSFESATSRYASEIYDYKLRDNYFSLEGSQLPNDPNFNSANVLITPSLGSLIRLSQKYGAEVQAGGDIPLYSDYIDVIGGTQNYDLNSWATTKSIVTGNDKIEIKKVYYESIPAMSRLISSYLGSSMNLDGQSLSLGLGSYSNYLMLPTNFDLLKAQAIEFNEQMRRSSHTFSLVNNVLKIFPIPTQDGKMFFDYIKVSERDTSFDINYLGNTPPTNSVITNISNVPFSNITYSSINDNGKTWIRNMTLVECYRRLALVRGKYSSIPLQNEDSLQLSGSDLYNLANELEKDLLSRLRELLDFTSRQKQLEKKSLETESVKSTLTGIPMPVYIF